jgi:hypothetical protein
VEALDALPAAAVCDERADAAEVAAEDAEVAAELAEIAALDADAAADAVCVSMYALVAASEDETGVAKLVILNVAALRFVPS